MNTMNRSFDIADGFPTAVLSLDESTGGGAQPEVGGLVLSLSKMFNHITKALQGHCVGEAVLLTYQGANKILHWSGFSRTAADPPKQNFEFVHRANLGDVSQTLTAVAVLQLLSAEGLTIDAPIAPYLPSDWTRGPNVDRITFKQLLTHTSGIHDPSAGGVDYHFLKAMVAGGTSADKSFQYQNQNFALFRILIPYLLGFREPVGPVKSTPLELAQAYLRYMNLRVFGPAGLAEVGARPVTPNQLLSYPFPAGNVHGMDFGDATLIVGSTGIHLSIGELSTLLAKLRFTDLLLNAEQRQLMDDHQLGWFSQGVTNGTVFQHTGSVGSSTSTLTTRLADFSVGVQVVVMHNSPVVPAPPYDLIVDAYNLAWEPR